VQELCKLDAGSLRFFDPTQEKLMIKPVVRGGAPRGGAAVELAKAKLAARLTMERDAGDEDNQDGEDEEEEEEQEEEPEGAEDDEDQDDDEEDEEEDDGAGE
jgi:ABC-type Zn2+ transport system substrate-binding protein/surface adhesin